MKHKFKMGWVPVCPESDTEFSYAAGPWWRFAREEKPSAIGSVVMHVSIPWKTLYKRGWRMCRCRAL